MEIEKITVGGTTYDIKNSFPSGGTAGQILTKKSNTDGNAGWTDPVQADWNENDATSPAFVKNKPKIPVIPEKVSFFENDAGYVTEDDAVLKSQGAENAGKVLIVGDDGNVAPGDTGGGGSNEDTPFRLIRTVSVTADDGVSEVVISADSDGNPFELDEAYAIITSKTNYGGYAYAALGVNGHTVGESRYNNTQLIRFFKFIGRWVATYSAYGYVGASYGSFWGLGHPSYTLNVSTDNPKITSLKFTFTTCEMEIWGR